MTEENIPIPEWREVGEMKKEFQKILTLMVAFEDRLNRYKDYEEVELHFLRRAATVCSLDKLRAFIRDLGANTFHVIFELDGESGYCASSYLHEDGIHEEKLERREEPGHPIHNVVSMTDVFSAGTRDVSEAFANSNISPDKISPRVRRLARDTKPD